MVTCSLKPNSPMPPYMVYPRFLSELDLSDTAKTVYVRLLDRGRLSGRNPGWIDEQGNVFLHYTIEALARDIGKGETVMKQALHDLEQEGLIKRVRQGPGRANRIYVCLPQSENRPIDRRKTDRKTVGKPTTNKKDSVRRNYQYQEGESL